MSPATNRAPRVVVVLPAFNEGKVIRALLHEIHTALDAAGYEDHEFVVVDDGSRDNTRPEVELAAAVLPVRLIPHAKNEGLGRALRSGLVAATEGLEDDDVVVTTEADGTQPVAVLPEIISAVQAGYDLVVATPFVDAEGFRGVPGYRRFLSRGANVVYATLFPIHTLHDYTNLVRAFRGGVLRRAVSRYGTEGCIVRRGFEAVPEFILRLRPLLPRIYEVPLVIDHRRLARRSQMPVLRTIRASLLLVASEMLARAQRRLNDM